MADLSPRAQHRVAVATFGRSDFSILRPLCRLLDADPEFDVGLWVGGAHFEQVSGHTVSDIEASDLPIWARVDCGSTDRSEVGTVRMMAAQMTGFASIASGQSDRGVQLDASAPMPDLLLILGDRFEAVAAGLAMVPMGLPVGHISGGSITEGAIDDVFRHCLTKIAALHFCELPQLARRIHRMGEPSENIFTTGALGLDAISTAAKDDFAAFVRTFGLPDLKPGYVLATLHPESRRAEVTAPMAEAMVGALLATGRQVVMTYPNADPGSDTVVDVIESAANHASFFCVRGFGADWYPTAMANAGLMIGNSSGGIIEAASFGLPVVDIGDRQKGREHGPNVIHCERERIAIIAAIDVATDTGFMSNATGGNIYGDGRGAQRVIAALKSIDWRNLAGPKRFADYEPSFAGARLELE
jgi:UDP-hydrolysing UDP-N-acetyl-D-glucosamine 2-epimerase